MSLLYLTSLLYESEFISADLLCGIASGPEADNCALSQGSAVVPIFQSATYEYGLDGERLEYDAVELNCLFATLCTASRTPL
jgi:hypothetical protein